MSDFEAISTDRLGSVLRITLNRPERLNAASLQLVDELDRAFAETDDARAILLTGAGRAFCAGADLRARGQQASGDPSEKTFAALTRHYNPLLLRIAELSIPLVCAVNGPAAGIGCSLALAGDFVLAGRSAYFLQAFVNVGLIPDGGASWALTRLVGRARATEMLMLGEKVPAEKALDWGMIHKVVDDADLMAEALALAQRLAAGPSLALGIMRRNIAAALDGTYAEALHMEAQGQRQARRSFDAGEGERAFLEKRKARFTGT